MGGRKATSRVAVAAFLAAILAACSPQQSTDSASSSSGVANAGGGSSSSASSTSAPPRPAPLDPSLVDTAQPEQVAEAVAIASVTWDTTVHESEYAAMRTAAPLLTAELAAQYQPVQGNPATDAAWAEALAMKAYSVPEVFTAEDTHVKPADTASTLYRLYEASWTWYDKDGASLPDSRTRYLYVTLTQQGDGRWLVSAFDVVDVED